MNEKKNLSPPSPSPLKEEKKAKKLSWTYNSQMHCLNLVCGVLRVEGVCTAKTILVQQGSTELRMHENRILVLPAC